MLTRYSANLSDQEMGAYTLEGLRRLAQIVKDARRNRSYREFEELTGLSHATIRRLELEEVKEPKDSTLEAIAPHTPYSLEELKAIATEKESSPIREYRVAEDLLPYVNQLPDIEAARLAQMIVARLAGMDYPS